MNNQDKLDLNLLRQAKIAVGQQLGVFSNDFTNDQVLQRFEELENYEFLTGHVFRFLSEPSYFVVHGITVKGLDALEQLEKLEANDNNTTITRIDFIKKMIVLSKTWIKNHISQIIISIITSIIAGYVLFRNGWSS